MQLRQADVRRLSEQAWESRLGENPVVQFRGRQYLRQRADGACVFLLENGRCRIHAEFGFELKPIACQLFPYMVAPGENASQMGVSFACQSVIENKGRLLNEQVPDALRIVLRGLPEVISPARGASLARGRNAEPNELHVLSTRLVHWLREPIPLAVRLDGLAWIAQTLRIARLNRVRGKRFEELMSVLFGALADELPLHPIAIPTARQTALFQNAIFSRTEDPKPIAQGAPLRVISILSQLRRGRAWRRGSGESVVPPVGVGWPTKVTFGGVSRVGSLRQSSDHLACDELVTRWLHASIEGGRVWGSGYYGWSAVEGLAALALSAACVGWLARLHAAGSGERLVRLVDLQAAIGRVDRTAGRAVWLGGWSERMRLSYLVEQEGLRRLIAAQYA